jgi:hypothetical protein
LEEYKWHFKEHVAVNDLFQAQNQPIPDLRQQLRISVSKNHTPELIKHKINI